MILIAHRGNVNGAKHELENSPKYLENLILCGQHIEIDLWLVDGEFWLGHDGPQHKINPEYLEYENFWIHAKNLQALEFLTSTDYKYFWHEEDDFTLTSNNKIWTYPNKDATKQSIVVCNTLEECIKYIDKGVYGVCSDYIGDITTGEK